MFMHFDKILHMFIVPHCTFLCLFSRYVRKSKPKKNSCRKGRSSGNNSSACPEDIAQTETSRRTESRRLHSATNATKPATAASVDSFVTDSSSMDRPKNVSQSLSHTGSSKCSKLSMVSSGTSLSSSVLTEMELTSQPPKPLSHESHPQPINAPNPSPTHHSNIYPPTSVQHDNVTGACISAPSVLPSTALLSLQSSQLEQQPEQQPQIKKLSCSNDLLDNLPEQKLQSKNYRDFSSQTGDRPSSQEENVKSNSPYSSTTSAGNFSPISDKANDGSPIREMSGETVIIDHSDPHSSSEFECVDDVGSQRDVGPSNNLEHLPSPPYLSFGRDRHQNARLGTVDLEPLDDIPLAHNNTQRGQSSPDSGVSFQACAVQSKTGMLTISNDNTQQQQIRDDSHNSILIDHAPNRDDLCRRCSLCNNDHIIQPDSPTPCMVLTKTDSSSKMEVKGVPCTSVSENYCIQDTLENHATLPSICASKSFSQHVFFDHSPLPSLCPHKHHPNDNHQHQISQENSEQENVHCKHSHFDHSGCEAKHPQSSSDSIELDYFSEQLVQGILNMETLREVTSSTLLCNSCADNSSISDRSHLSMTPTSSSASSLSLSLDAAALIELAQQQSSNKILNNLPPTNTSIFSSDEALCSSGAGASIAERRQFSGKISIHGTPDPPLLEGSKILNVLDESMEQIVSDAERISDGSNYNPSDSEADSDTAANARLRNKCVEKRVKRLRFQEQAGVLSYAGGHSPSKGMETFFFLFSLNINMHVIEQS